jgi:hypothetical protein
MTFNLTRYLNKLVFVSIPALFEDGLARPYRLKGAELSGLWLQSDELTRRLLPDLDHDRASSLQAIFVPFAQIAGVALSAPMLPQPLAEPQTRMPATAGLVNSAKPAGRDVEDSGRSKEVRKKNK